MAPRPSLARLRHRPSPGDWSEDELVTLAEAVELLFPDGPFTAASLRAAIRRGELGASTVCGRVFTTLGQLRLMSDPIRRAATPAAGRPAREVAASARARVARRRPP